MAKNINYLVNYYLIFSAKKFIYDTAIAVNYSVFKKFFKLTYNANHDSVK